MQQRTPIFHFTQGFAATLLAEDIPLLQTFFEANPDYFYFAHGIAPMPNEAQKEFDDLPPAEMPFKQRFFLGFFDAADNLLGMASGLTDFIADGVGHIGLFITATQLHGTGAARDIYQALEQWLRAQGMHSLRLGVIQGNKRAQLFWQRNGFQLVRERGPLQLGQRSHMLDVMVKPLSKLSINDYLYLVQRDRPGAA
jgi:RimJ/RimL family protein N-acetyltransferase